MEFDAETYRKGYAAAESLIDTYGVACTRIWYPDGGASSGRSADYCLGFLTCIGVTLERQLQG